MVAAMITLNCFATLAHYAPPGNEFPFTPGMTVGSLVTALKIPEGEVQTVFVNGLVTDFSRVLTDGDRVGIFPAIAGG